MKNVLTYHFELEPFENSAKQRFHCHIGGSFKNRNPREEARANLLAVTDTFRKTLSQHKLSMGGDIKHELTEVGRIVADEVRLFMRIDLTFKDETTALLFKLSHDGGAA